jgi:RimJ/RimL family protein N-acetyltransferase
MNTSVHLFENGLAYERQPNDGAHAAGGDWRQAPPILTGDGVLLRELQKADAPALLAMLGTADVRRFITPPPSTLEGFDRFIQWSRSERAAGRYICFAVVPRGLDSAAGIVQVRQLTPDFSTAEWGFALGSPFWGTGLFVPAARLAIEFAFETIGVLRLEARAAVANGRGSGALRKLGALREGVLRSSLFSDGQYIDQALWSIVREDWRHAKVVWGSIVH